MLKGDDYLNINDLFELKELGVFFQINASSIVNKFKKKKFKKTIKLIKNDLIDFVASDCHNNTTRAPKLEEAYNKIKRKFGDKIAKKIFYDNQKKLLLNTF